MKPFHDKHFLLEILYFGNSIIEIVLVKNTDITSLREHFFRFLPVFRCVF